MTGSEVLKNVFNEGIKNGAYTREGIKNVGKKIAENYKDKDINILKSDISSGLVSLDASIMKGISDANTKELVKETNKSAIGALRISIDNLNCRFKQGITLGTETNLQIVISSLKMIGMANEVFLKKISKGGLFIKDEAQGLALKELCSDCLGSTTFDSNVLKAVMYFQAIVGEYRSGNAVYGVDGVAGLYSLKALNNVLKGFTEKDIEPQYLNPVKEPVKEEPKKEPVKEEPKKEPVKEEPKKEPVKEEPKKEPIKEEPKKEPIKAPEIKPIEKTINTSNDDV